MGVFDIDEFVQGALDAAAPIVLIPFIEFLYQRVMAIGAGIRTSARGHERIRAEIIVIAPVLLNQPPQIYGILVLGAVVDPRNSIEIGDQRDATGFCD